METKTFDVIELMSADEAKMCLERTAQVSVPCPGCNMFQTCRDIYTLHHQEVAGTANKTSFEVQLEIIDKQAVITEATLT